MRRGTCDVSIALVNSRKGASGNSTVKVVDSLQKKETFDCSQDTFLISIKDGGSRA
jgi:hypothetical protein